MMVTTEREVLPGSLHNTATMNPTQQKRKLINRGKALLKRVAVIGYWWYSKRKGKDSTGNGWQSLMEVATPFGLSHHSVTDMVKKAIWRVRGAVGDREGEVMTEAISVDSIP